MTRVEIIDKVKREGLVKRFPTAPPLREMLLLLLSTGKQVEDVDYMRMIIIIIIVIIIIIIIEFKEISNERKRESGKIASNKKCERDKQTDC